MTFSDTVTAIFEVRKLAAQFLKESHWQRGQDLNSHIGTREFGNWNCEVTARVKKQPKRPMAMMATAVPDSAAPPLKAHAVADSSEGGLSAQLRHALRDVAGQDPALAKAIDDRHSLTDGGKHAKSFSAGQKSAPAQALSPDTERSASPEEHDRSYFALLHKISKLEAANARFED